VKNITKSQALVALNSLTEIIDGPNDMAWLHANLLNWLIESNNESSATWLNNILWAAGDRIDDVLILIKYISLTNTTLLDEFPSQVQKIVKFVDKELGRKHFF